MSPFQLDTLTGAYTRAALGQQMTRWIELSQAGGIEFSVVIIDLDYFKSINDAFGHLRGDQALLEATGRIKASIRRQDQVYRYGGDEFVVLLPGSGKTQAIKVVERIRDTLTSTRLEGSPPVSISASYGLASYPEDAHTPEGLFAVMDRRLYQGKALGRGRIVAGESEPPAERRLQPPERMVERDMPYQQAQQFLGGLPAGAGLLQVTGRPGSGRSRFLTEVTRLARLQGYAVWSLKGSPVLRFRKGGALATFQRLAGLTRPLHHPAELLEVFQNWVVDQGLAGLLLCIDDLDGIDTLSLETLGALLEHAAKEHFPLGLLCSGDLPADGGASFEHITRRTLVELQPVSEAGLRIWLRYSLNWEPPETFIAWFYQQTGGLPSAITNGLRWLFDQGILRPTAGAQVWSIGALPAQLGAPHPAPDRPESNLPVISSDFFGREEELWQIKDLLDGRDPLTICGADGMGKTRLALQAAAEMRESYPDGIFWLALDERPSREDLLFLLARVMDYPIRSQEKIEEEVFSLYQEKHILLVLDGLAPGSHAVPLAQRLARTAPQVQLLITSLRPLNFPGERVLTLSGLPFPDPEQLDASEMEQSPAVQMFLAGARGSLAGFNPTPEDWPAILQICRLVEGMPLAIEMAGVWVSSFTCQQIAGKIEQNIQFLQQPAAIEQPAAVEQPVQGSRRNRLPGPGSITAVMDSFWQLFSRSEQATLSALSVFRLSFSAEAAAQVADASPFFLDALIAKKYLHITSSQRYTMHFLLASYAAAQIQSSPELETGIRQRHAQYYLGKLAENSSHLAGWQTLDEPVFRDLENFRQAWLFAIHAGDDDLLRRGLDGMFALFFNIGHFLEGMRLFTLALDSLPAGEAPEPPGRNVSALRAGLLTRLGEFSFHTGSYQQGLPLLEEAVRVLKTLDSPGELAEVLRLLANLVGALGQYDRAIRLLQDGLAMTDKESAPHLYFNLLNRAGVMASYKKDFPQSNAYFERALAVARQVKDTGKIAMVLNNQGSIALETGDLPRARRLLVESEALCHNLGLVTLHASVLDTLANVEAGLGSFPSAHALFSEALGLVQENDAIPLAMEILVGVAEMWRREGLAVPAAELVRYIRKYGSIPDDVQQRAVELDKLLDDQPGESRWQNPDRPLQWVIRDVIEMLEREE